MFEISPVALALAGAVIVLLILAKLEQGSRKSRRFAPSPEPRNGEPTVMETTPAEIQPMEALEAFPAEWTSLGRAFLAETTKRPDKVLVTDTTGLSMKGSDARNAAAACAHYLSTVIGDDEKYVGIILPTSVPGAVFNFALALMGKVAVNINYGLSSDLVNHCIKLCDIKHVITVQELLDKTGLKPEAELVYAQDAIKAAKVDDPQGYQAWVRAALTASPAEMVKYFPGLAARPDDEATVLFTTGSTDLPKGVVLSHKAIIANAVAIHQRFGIEGSEKLLGSLPFGHSLGYTGTVWTPVLLGAEVVYHADPRDIGTICNTVESFGITTFVTSPSLMRFYLKRSKPGQFDSMKLLLLGSEKLKPELCDAIVQKLGIQPVEAFGCTELGPLSAANTPLTITTQDGRQIPGNKLGTVGRPTPGTAVKITDMASGEVVCACGKDHQGLVWFKGPQVMIGYLKRPDLTEKAVVDGWYRTGDIGFVDEDGFVVITDRESRFAKVGGEMVPMAKVEAAIREVSGADELSVHVTYVPDQVKGERLVVLYTGDTFKPKAVIEALAGKLPPLWIPSESSFACIPVPMPLAASGKLDLSALKKLAAGVFAKN